MMPVEWEPKFPAPQSCMLGIFVAASRAGVTNMAPVVPGRLRGPQESPADPF